MGRGSRFLVSMAALACVSIQSSSDALALNEAAATSDSLALSPEWIAVTGGVIIVAIALAVVAIVRLSRDRKQALGTLEQVNERLKLSEAALLEAKSELELRSRVWQTVFDAIEPRICVIGGDKRVLLCNKPWREMMCLEPGEAIGMTQEDVAKRASELGVHGAVEIEMLSQDTADLERTVESTLERYSGKVDSVRRTDLADGGYVVIVSDITKWKRAEAMLKESEHRLTALLEASPGGVSINALDGTRLWANAELARMYGRDVDQIIGTTSEDDYLSPKARQEIIERFERDGTLRNHEVEQRRADGRFFWVLLTLASLEYEGQPARIVWVFDITERKRALDSLKETEAQLRIALRHMPGGIRFVDEDGCYVLMNDGYTEIHDFPPNLLEIGKHKSVETRFQAERGDFGEGDREELAWKQLGVEAARRGPAGWEHRTASGKVLQINTSPTPDGGAVDVVVDISALKQAEDEALAARRSAEQANQAKSTFLAGMSHEIRTPMNVVVGIIELLEQAGLSQDQATLAVTMKEAADALLSLIDDVLDFSKIEAGELTIHPTPLALERLVNTVVGMVGANASKKGIDLTVAMASDLPLAVLADKTRMRQILLNLLSNAIKFTNEGKVVVRVFEESSDGPKRLIRFEVLDTGIGIPEGDLDDLFDPFKQASTNAIGEYGGTGLGLSICERLVTKMGGDIGATSELGIGSTFWFTVPLEVTELDERDEPDSQNLDSLPSVHRVLMSTEDALAAGQLILVAEDQPNNRDVLSRQLDALGFASDIAEDGEQALRMFKEKSYGLVLTDCHMPNLDGFGLVAAIREMEEQSDRRTPVIALTANALAGEAERCLAAGMDAFIAKPAGLKTLGGVLAKWLNTPAATGNVPRPGDEASTISPGDNEQSPFDLDLLEDLMGDRDLGNLERMVARFRPLLEDYLQAMEAAFAAGDLDALRAVVHKAASGAGSTTARPLMEAMINVEDAIAKAGSHDALAEKVERARREANRVAAWTFSEP